MQNPIETLKNCGKKPGLEVWVVRAVKPPKNSFPCLFKSETKTVAEYEIFSVASKRHGVFYVEDLYIVLKTSSDLEKKDVHFWFGKSYEETPPSWINNFEDLELTWKATQHFEFQGFECDLFESYFHKVQPAIRYKKGKHPDPSAERVRGDTRFYKLERHDKANYRVREIPFNIALMTKEECFILDTDYNTRIYVSDRTPVIERNKSVIIAKSIRDLDHEGGDVEVVDLTTFTNEADREAYVKATNLLQEEEEPPPQIDFDQPDDDPESVELSLVSFIFSDDVEYGYPPRFRYVPKLKKAAAVRESSVIRMRKSLVSRVRRLFGNEKETEPEIELPSFEEKFIKSPLKKPLKREQLNSKKCYMLQGSIGQGIFLWIGKSSDPALKEQLIDCLRYEVRKADIKNPDYVNKDFEIDEIGTDAYTKKEEKKEEEKENEQNEEDLPKWTHVCKVTEGNEPIKFKRYFPNWE